LSNLSEGRTTLKKLLTLSIIAFLLMSIFQMNACVRANPGTIYIRPDGSVDPPTAPIQRDGDVYTFTDNIYDSIVVERDDIVVEGSGFTLQGTGYYGSNGIFLSERTNVTIKNMSIKTFGKGIYLLRSSNNTLSRNNIAENKYHGILLEFSNYTNILENKVTNHSDDGIWLFCSSFNSMVGNNITASQDNGILLTYSSNHNEVFQNDITANNASGIEIGLRIGDGCADNRIVDNSIINNAYGIDLSYSTDNDIDENNIMNNREDGILLSASPDNSIVGNSVINNYAYGIRTYGSSRCTFSMNIIINNSYDGIHIEGSADNSIIGSKIENNRHGILLFDTSENIISENNITNNKWGVTFSASSKNVVSRNNIVNNINSGVVLWSNTTLSGNTIMNNGGNGIESPELNSIIGNIIMNNTGDGIQLSSFNKVVQNTIIANHNNGIKLFSDNNEIFQNNITANNNAGIEIHAALTNRIVENSITNNNIGVFVSSDFSSSGNRVVGNYIKNNKVGIQISSRLSQLNIFYHNNIDNVKQVNITTPMYYPNFWNDSYPSGGNYWSDYISVDAKSGPYQNETGSDGIGDTPYVIDANNQDNYPLMKLYERPHAQPKIISVTFDKTDVNYGDWVTVTVKARNDGNKADEMYISVSLPDNPPIDNIQMVSHDLQDAYILPVEAEVWGNYGTTYPMVLQYPLVEGFKENWERGETKTLQFKVKPQNTGTFRFFVKTTAQVNGEWSYDPQSGTKDQQNEYVYVYTAVVREVIYLEFDGAEDLVGNEGITGYALDTTKAKLYMEIFKGANNEPAFAGLSAWCLFSPTTTVDSFTITFPAVISYYYKLTGIVWGQVVASIVIYKQISGEWNKLASSGPIIIEDFWALGQSEGERKDYPLDIAYSFQEYSLNAGETYKIEIQWATEGYIALGTYLFGGHETYGEQSWYALLNLSQPTISKEIAPIIPYSLTKPDGLALVIHSPVELYITDPLGRSVGVDPLSNTVRSEIPGAYFNAAQLVLAIPFPVEGSYEVKLKGTDNGIYELTVYRYKEGSEVESQTFSREIGRGDTHSYRVDLTEETLTVFEVTEGFPMWIVGIVVGITAVAIVTTVILWKRKRLSQKGKQD